MPKVKTPWQNAAGKLISAIQKEWLAESGASTEDFSADTMDAAHTLLSARDAHDALATLKGRSVRQYVGDLWLRRHPSVVPYVQALDRLLAESASEAHPGCVAVGYVFPGAACGLTRATLLDMRLPGQRHDAASGLSQNYFRDYEPGSGRYVQSDPIGLRGGIATYEYARSAPLMWKDARGLSPISCTNIQSRVGAGTIGTIQCDGKGGFEIVNCASSCMRNCTAAHESQHITDYKARYGANGCANRARGDLPDDESATPFDLTPYDRFRAMSECRAYAASKRCAQSVLKNSCGCEKEANATISAADAQRREYSCSAYGL